MPPVIQTEEEKPKRKGKLKITKLLKIKKPKKHGKLNFDSPSENNATAEHPDISAIIKDVKVYANNEEICRKSPANKDDESSYNSTNCTRDQQVSLDDTTNQPTKKDYKKHRNIKKAFKNFAKFKTKTSKKADENGEIPDANYYNGDSIKPVYSEQPSNKYNRKEDYDHPAEVISGSLDADLDVKNVTKNKSRKLEFKNPLKTKAQKEKKTAKKNKKQSDRESESIQNQDASRGNNGTDGENDAIRNDMEVNDNEVLHTIQEEISRGKAGKLAVLKTLILKTSSENISFFDKDNQNKAPSRSYDMQETGIEGPSYLRDYILDYEDRVRKCENENQSNKKKPKLNFKIKKKKDNLPKNEALSGENSGAFHSAKKKNKDSQDNERLDIQDERLGAKALPESKSKKGILKKWKKIKSKKLFKLKYKNDKKETVETHYEIVAENPDDFHADNYHNKSENSATIWERDTEVYYQSEVQNETAAAEPDVHGKRFSDFVKTRKRKNNKYLKCCCMRQEEVGDYYSPANEERKAGIFTNLDEIPNGMCGRHQLAVFDASKDERRKVHLIDTASC